MGDENKATPAVDVKKTRRQNVNKVDIKITNAGDATRFIAAVRAKLTAEESATKTYNNFGFTTLAFDELDPEGLQSMIVMASDVLARKDAEMHQVTSQIVANTSRRHIETKVTADYEQIARRQGFKNLDDFAKKQTNGATGKHFKDFAELIALAVDAELVPESETAA